MTRMRPGGYQLRRRPEVAVAWLRRQVRRQLRTPFAPAVGAVLLFWASLTPSLLPRSPVYQGVVAAAAGLLGYGLGSLLGWIVRSCGGRLRGHSGQRACLVVGIAAVVATVVMLTAYLRWENRLRDLVGLDRIGIGSLLRMLLGGLVVFVGLLAVARGLKAAGRLLGRFVGRFLPPRVATVTGGLVVALVAYVLVTGVATNRLLESLDATYMTANDEFSTDVPHPRAASCRAAHSPA